ncbi:MAG: cation:proton antiporter [Ardenticatenales bacterium]|nr:cation:proton antiporter [Ardenticatenales bacterium]
MTPAAELLAVLAVIILGAKLGGALSIRLGQPAVLGEILFGLLLGPTGLDLMHRAVAGRPIFSHGEVVVEGVHLLAELGVVLLMFLAGLETDPAEMKRVGLPATGAAVGGALLPFAGGWAVGTAFGLELGPALFLGTILCATSVSISAQTLVELDALDSDEGRAILGAAVIDDVLGILLLSIVVGVLGTGGNDSSVLGLILRMLLFFIVAVAVGRPARRLVRRFARQPVSEGLLAGALVMTFAFGWLAEALGGVAAITGAFIAGVFLGRTEMGHEIESRVKIAVYGLFLPIFLVDIGLRADARAALGGALGLAVAVVVVAVVTKFAGAALGARISGFGWRSSVRVGAGMVSRGEVGLIIAGVGLAQGVVSQNEFAVAVLMVVVTTVVTPPLLRAAFRGAPAAT